MRKVHYRVVLDVLTTEDDDADGAKELEGMVFWPRPVGQTEKIDIQDVTVESVEVTDSR